MKLISFDILNNETSDIEIEQMTFDNFLILPIRNTVLFPRIITPITVTRPEAIDLVTKIYNSKDQTLALITQKNDKLTKDIRIKDLYKHGTLGQILKIIELKNGELTVILQGKYKFALEAVAHKDPFLTGKITIKPEEFDLKDSKQEKELLIRFKEMAKVYFGVNMNVVEETNQVVESVNNLGFVTYFVANYLNIKISEKQKLLDMHQTKYKVQKILGYIEEEINVLKIRNEVQDKANIEMQQQQRDYYLRQQLLVLQNELNDDDGFDDEVKEIIKKAKSKNFPKYAQNQLNKELKKIKRVGINSPEYSNIVGYCDFLVSLPWSKYSRDNFNIHKAEKILENNHSGLKETKERILEHLAVVKLKKDTKVPILCLVGPPGVGKTSLARSIAEAMGRKYIRMALGGVSDESEIRGHRKTYVGSMAGKILQNIKRVGVSNPLILLDEIDKIGENWHGSPSFALLEVLDPEQNNTFIDNYLEVPYDLSKILFLATANNENNIDQTLLDRMEIVKLEGYIPQEKINIAHKHLIPKLLTDHGLEPKHIKISENVIQNVIDHYTWESGVRELERKLATLIRKVAKSLAKEEEYKQEINVLELSKLLGMVPYYRQKYESLERAGITIGLSWTGFGGDILFVETTLISGTGALKLSGRLGQVMNESAQIAFSYLKSYGHKWNIKSKIFKKYDLHIHFPEGHVQKDGPSAGCAIFIAILSVYTQRKVKEKLAMTGELTLRGQILPIGGVSEKLLAAHKAGIKEVIFPKVNKESVNKLDFDYVKDITIHYANHIDEIVDIALTDQIIESPFSYLQETKEALKEEENNKKKTMVS